MFKLSNVWQKDKIDVLLVVVSAAFYVIVGCLWYLAPNSKFYPSQPRTDIEWIVPILGWATFFLNYPAYVSVPLFAVAGVLAGLLTKFLMTSKDIAKPLGAVIWIVLALINFEIGLFFYIFAIMIW